MLVDRVFGADLLTMFTVDYEPGGSAQQHDHPFEEAYFFLAGEVEAELDGTVYQIHAGDVVFSAVGGVHGFYNNGTEQVRWIETQAPQPPARHAYRWLADLAEVRGGATMSSDGAVARRRRHARDRAGARSRLRGNRPRDDPDRPVRVGRGGRRGRDRRVRPRDRARPREAEDDPRPRWPRSGR